MIMAWHSETRGSGYAMTKTCGHVQQGFCREGLSSVGEDEEVIRHIVPAGE